MNLKKCSDEKLARFHKNNLKRRDIEMEDYVEFDGTDQVDEDGDCDLEVTYQCPGCEDEWQICVSEDGNEIEILPEDEICRHCGTKGMQL